VISVDEASDSLLMRSFIATILPLYPYGWFFIATEIIAGSASYLFPRFLLYSILGFVEGLVEQSIIC
jgi:hypothetical protein